MIQLYLYGTVGCHLCDDALNLLLPIIDQSGNPFELESIDIVEDDKLMALYSISIPVLKRLDTQAEISWPFGVSELGLFLA